MGGVDEGGTLGNVGRGRPRFIKRVARRSALERSDEKDGSLGSRCALSASTSYLGSTPFDVALIAKASKQSNTRCKSRSSNKSATENNEYLGTPYLRSTPTNSILTPPEGCIHHQCTVPDISHHHLRVSKGKRKHGNEKQNKSTVLFSSFNEEHNILLFQKLNLRGFMQGRYRSMNTTHKSENGQQTL